MTRRSRVCLESCQTQGELQQVTLLSVKIQPRAFLHGNDDVTTDDLARTLVTNVAVEKVRNTFPYSLLANMSFCPPLATTQTADPCSLRLTADSRDETFGTVWTAALPHEKVLSKFGGHTAASVTAGILYVSEDALLPRTHELVSVFQANAATRNWDLPQETGVGEMLKVKTRHLNELVDDLQATVLKTIPVTDLGQAVVRFSRENGVSFSDPKGSTIGHLPAAVLSERRDVTHAVSMTLVIDWICLARHDHNAAPPAGSEKAGAVVPRMIHSRAFPIAGPPGSVASPANRGPSN